MVIFILFLLLIPLAPAFVVLDDLRVLPKKDFGTNATQLRFDADHRNRQPNQPPLEWTNVTLGMPDFTTGLQLTSNTTREAYIPFYSVDELGRRVYVSLVWFGAHWTLSIGWRV